MKMVLGAALGLLIGSQVALAGTPKSWDDTKPAWKWSLEERLAKRFDPVELEARAASLRSLAQLSLPSEPLAMDVVARDKTPYINGGETPELFTPMELFISLIERAYPADGQYQQEGRRKIEERAVALGFGTDLWPRLGRLTSPFLELRREDLRLGLAEQRGERVKRPTGETLCRARAEALAAAQVEFGEEPFRRLLYEAVAQGVSVPVLTAVDLRYWEGGCR
jgi:hypothetical protein